MKLGDLEKGLIARTKKGIMEKLEIWTDYSKQGGWISYQQSSIAEKPRPDGFTGETNQIFKEESASTALNSFKTLKGGETNTLTLNPALSVTNARQGCSQKGDENPHPVNVDVNILRRTLATEFNSLLKGSLTWSGGIHPTMGWHTEVKKCNAPHPWNEGWITQVFHWHRRRFLQYSKLLSTTHTLNQLDAEEVLAKPVVSPQLMGTAQGWRPPPRPGARQAPMPALLLTVPLKGAWRRSQQTNLLNSTIMNLGNDFDQSRERSTHRRPQTTN